MAVGVLIISNEGGKKTAAMVAASVEQAKELGETFSLPAYKYMSISTEQAIKYVSRAWDVMGDAWEQEK
jgi:predicted transcriptional regulator YdeE